MHLDRTRFILIALCVAAALAAGAAALLRPATAHSQASAIVIDHTAVAQFEQIPDAYIEAAAELAMLFRHASVGQNISDGLDCLGNNFDGRRPSRCDRGIPPGEVLYDEKYDRNNWDFEFHSPPPNPNPGWWNKVAFFVERVDGLAAGSYDYAGFKLGYVDGGSGSNAPALFWNRNTDPRYPGVDDLEALEARSDVTLVWWTMGLARSIGTQEATDFNEQMRAYAAGRPVVLMDIADIESHRPDGSACVDNQGRGLPALCDEYTEEIDAGHLNALGQQRMAKAVWVMMARLAGWTPGGPPPPTRTPTATTTAPTAVPTESPTPTPEPRVIAGRVVDDSGAPQPGVLISAGPGRQATTGPDGRYRFEELPAGEYAVRASLSGWVIDPAVHTIQAPPGGTADFIVRPEPAPFLGLPVDGDLSFGRTLLPGAGHGPGRIAAWFDHSPSEGFAYDLRLTQWTGGEFTHVRQGCTPGISCRGGSIWTDFLPHGDAELALAAAIGRVLAAGNDPLLGAHVWLDHRNGYATLYAHLAPGSVLVSVDDEVAATQELGRLGVSGAAAGARLGFGVYYDRSGDRIWTPDEAVDPFGWSPLAAPGASDPWPASNLYLWNGEVAAEGDFGPGGGSLTAPSGLAALAAPTGTLPTTETVRLAEGPPAAPAAGNGLSAGHGLYLQEGGEIDAAAALTLAAPLTLTFSFTAAPAAAHMDVAQARLMRWSGETWEAQPGSYAADTQTLSAAVQAGGAYDVQGPRLCTDDLLEPNDSAPAAAALALAEGVAQPFDIAADVDWLRIDGVEGALYELTVADAGGAVSAVQVLDAALQPLGVAPGEEGGIQWAAPADAAIFVRVAPAEGSATGCGATFTLTLEVTLPPGAVYLPSIMR